jgi:hypothetical protein
MGSWLSGIALAGAALVAAGAAAAQQNLGFEADGAGSPPAHWEIVGGEDGARDADVSVDRGSAAEGERSLRVSQQVDAGFVRIAQRIALSRPDGVRAARRVRLSAAVLGNDTPRGGPSIWLRIAGPKGPMFVDSRADARGQAQRVSFAPRGSAAAPDERGSAVTQRAASTDEPRQWQRYVLELPLPDDADEAVLGASLRGQGTAWFDDFRLEVVAVEGPPPSAAAVRYVDAALAIVREHALYSKQVDWARVRSAALAHARGATAPSDTYGALRFALRELGDQHSYLLAPSSAAALLREPVSNARTGRAAVEPRAQIVGGRFRYLSVPGFAGGTPGDQARFAEGLQSRIGELDKSGSCGWILDLRANSGGNLWPMLAGIGPLLGEGNLGASVYPDGERRSFWYRDGQAGFGDYVQLRVMTPRRLESADAPLAVLLGPRTASSAEVLATALDGRPSTRSFGAPTSGLSAGNRTFELADRAALVLTVAATADRTGHVAIGPIVPDELVERPRSGVAPRMEPALAPPLLPETALTAGGAQPTALAPSTREDVVLEAAVAWLANEGCR